MVDLFIRALSQGLQAFVPVAFFTIWAHRSGRAELVPAVRRGVAAAVPATVAATLLFQATTRLALWECAFAAAATALAVSFVAVLWRPTGAMASAPRKIGAFGVAAATTLVVARQTGEIGVVFAAAAFQLRAMPATMLVCGGAVLAFVISRLCVSAGTRVSPAAAANAVRIFAVMFLAQAALYAFHEAAEARLLPASELLHAATEPYGPDGRIGYRISWLLVILPLAAMSLTVLREHLAGRIRIAALACALAVTCVGAVPAGRALTAARTGAAGTVDDAGSVPAVTVASLSRAPHVLFRHTRDDRAYGTVSVAPLLSPDAARAVTDLSCERVSFGGDRGFCLQVDRGMHLTFRAVIVNRMLKPERTIPLDGAPSRTRISPDGRFGAITVFVAGAQHGYAGSDFSTKTTIVDMNTGEVLGDLEQFTTSRRGVRFQAADFNFWGVTFTRNSNVFYATLKSAGATYLVRGDVALRKITVISDNVECPSVSPDDRLIAFKRRVSPMLSAGRLYLLDLATMKERPLSEERYIDDQAEWLDDSHVLYAVAHDRTADVWVAGVNDTSPPFIFMHDAQSPAVVR